MNQAWELRPTDADYVEAARLLTSVDDPVLLAHVSPDGDALGSALAVGLALRELGQSPMVSFGDDPLVVPRVLRFLPGQELLVPASEVPDAPTVMATFDASSIERLGVLRPKAEAAQALVVVDHHASYTGFGSHHVCEVGTPATAVLALRLIDVLGVRITREMAACIYTGLITDTGSFRYAATTPVVHEIAARLMATGIDHNDIARTIYDTAPFGYVRVLGAALDRAALEPSAVRGRGLVWTTVPLSDRLASGLALDSVEPVIDAVRVAEEAEVAVVLKEHEDGTWRVSMRSRGAVDVAKASLALGGGGHRYAAGFTSHDDVDTTLARVRAALEVAADAGQA
jgi:phosphoesterase RecJ-like protein